MKYVHKCSRKRKENIERSTQTPYTYAECGLRRILATTIIGNVDQFLRKCTS
jgi:hypothetical protein